MHHRAVQLLTQTLTLSPRRRQLCLFLHGRATLPSPRHSVSGVTSRTLTPTPTCPHSGCSAGRGRLRSNHRDSSAGDMISQLLLLSISTRQFLCACYCLLSGLDQHRLLGICLACGTASCPCRDFPVWTLRGGGGSFLSAAVSICCALITPEPSSLVCGGHFLPSWHCGTFQTLSCVFSAQP